MNPIRHLRRLAATLAALASALLAFAAAAPAAFASGPGPLPAGWSKHPPLPPGHIHQPVYQAPVPVPIHTVVVGGMPRWQIAPIEARAALLAAVLAVLADRARARAAAPDSRRRLSHDHGTTGQGGCAHPSVLAGGPRPSRQPIPRMPAGGRPGAAGAGCRR
jgi:hypothetical protein